MSKNFKKKLLMNNILGMLLQTMEYQTKLNEGVEEGGGGAGGAGEAEEQQQDLASTSNRTSSMEVENDSNSSSLAPDQQEKEEISHPVSDLQHRQRRLAMNRRTARERRRKKMRYIEQLNTSQDNLTFQNKVLAKENNEMKSMIESLKRYLYGNRTSEQQPESAAGTQQQQRTGRGALPSGNNNILTAALDQYHQLENWAINNFAGSTTSTSGALRTDDQAISSSLLPYMLNTPSAGNLVLGHHQQSLQPAQLHVSQILQQQQQQHQEMSQRQTSQFILPPPSSSPAFPFLPQNSNHNILQRMLSSSSFSLLPSFPVHLSENVSAGASHLAEQQRGVAIGEDTSATILSSNNPQHHHLRSVVAARNDHSNEQQGILGSALLSSLCPRQQQIQLPPQPAPQVLHLLTSSGIASSLPRDSSSINQQGVGENSQKEADRSGGDGDDN